MKKITAFSAALLMAFCLTISSAAATDGGSNISAVEQADEVGPTIYDENGNIIVTDEEPIAIEPQAYNDGSQNEIDNPATGVALALIPVVIAIVALVIFRRKKK